MDEFFNKFESTFSTEVTKKFIEKSMLLHKETCFFSLKIFSEFQEKIKELEFKLKFGDLEEEKKKEVEKEIEELNKECEEKINFSSASLSSKLKELENEIRKKDEAEGAKWVKDLMETYSNNIESEVIKFVNQ